MSSFFSSLFGSANKNVGKKRARSDSDDDENRSSADSTPSKDDNINNITINTTTEVVKEEKEQNEEKEEKNKIEQIDEQNFPSSSPTNLEKTPLSLTLAQKISQVAILDDDQNDIFFLITSKIVQLLLF